MKQVKVVGGLDMLLYRNHAIRKDVVYMGNQLEFLLGNFQCVKPFNVLRGGIAESVYGVVTLEEVGCTGMRIAFVEQDDRHTDIGITLNTKKVKQYLEDLPNLFVGQIKGLAKVQNQEIKYIERIYVYNALLNKNNNKTWDQIKTEVRGLCYGEG